MNAETQTNAVETILASSHAMLTVNDLRRVTGLDEKAVRAQLKTLAQQGQIDHIPGRGRYDGKYGLLRTTPQTAVKDSLTVQAPTGGDSEGGEADITRTIVGRVMANADEMDPKIVRAAAHVELHHVIADIRAAVGDKTGKIMLGELAAHIGKLYELGEAHREACMTWERSMMAAIGEDGVGSVVDAIENLKAERDASRRINAEMVADLDNAKVQSDKLQRMLAAIREHLSPFPVGIDPSSMTEVELAESAAAAIRDGLERIFSKSSDDGASEKLVSDLRAELDNATALNTKLDHLLGVERQTSAALREQLDHITHGGESAATGLCASQIDSFAVIAPKRPMRRFTGHDSAVKSAMAAASNGSGRGEVFALVHVGTAKRGAVWSPTK